jgi:hypothetical protein
MGKKTTLHYKNLKSKYNQRNQDRKQPKGHQHILLIKMYQVRLRLSFLLTENI